MASEYVNCATCDKKIKVRVEGDRRTREWKLSSWRWDCDECKEEAKIAAAKINAEDGLPGLVGSGKQIAWAELIRKQKIAAIDTALKNSKLSFSDGHNHITLSASDPRVQAAFDSIRTRNSASWWIDVRDWDAKRLLVIEYEKTETPPPPAEQQLMEELEAEALAESTVRPEMPVSETVAEISISKNKINVVFPERLDEFRT